MLHTNMGFCVAVCGRPLQLAAYAYVMPALQCGAASANLVQVQLHVV